MAKAKKQLGEAYDLVLADLFTKLTKIKAGIIQLGNLGTLHKKQRETRVPKNGKVYVYYQVSFKASNLLKKELDK